MSTPSHYLKKIQGKAVQAVVDDLVDEKQGGWKSRTAWDSYTAKLHCLELMGIKITRDALYKRVDRQSKRKQNGLPKPIQEVAPIEEVATYSKEHDISSISSPSTESHITHSMAGIQDLSDTTVSSSKAGRPKGSTHQKKREDMKNYQDCMNAITMAYSNELTQCRAQSKTVMQGFLKEVIEQKKVEILH